MIPDSRHESILKTFLTQQLGALTRLTAGACHPFLAGGSGSTRCSEGDLQILNHVLNQVLMFRTGSVRSLTFPSFLSLSYQFWKYFEWNKLWRSNLN